MAQALVREKNLRNGGLATRPMPRIERLKQSYLSLEPTLSIDRARIETRAMKETEGEPVVTRRAKVFAAAAREMPIDIFPDQLLVGSISVRPLCTNIVPRLVPSRNMAVSLGLRKEDVHSAGLSEDEKREMEEKLTPYWKEQGRAGKVRQASHYGHNVHSHEKVVRKGFLGIKKEAEERLARLDLSDAEEVAKVPFLEGVVTAMEAAAGIGKRYAAKARELAEKEEDTRRKKDLLGIAEVCDWVPANPARTFYEALQAYYLSFMMLHWEVVPSPGFSQGRMDQYLYPYYEDDLREGKTTREEAQELIDCFFLAVNYESEPGSISVGGVKANGNDATNELSYMFLEATMHTMLPSPWLSVLVHSQMPDDLLIKACQLSSLGSGHPQFVNNDVMVAQALARGSMGGPTITLEDARSASPTGCFELVIPGKDSGYLYFNQPNLALAMELVMTNGVRRSDRETIGLETGDPRQFRSFEEVQEAFRKQVAWMRRNIQIAGTNREQIIRESTPTVYESALIDDCIDRGLSRELGGAHYNFNNGGAVLGSSDAGDSLTAIKKLVFDDEKITMAELCDALEHNFEGHEELHQILLKAPKFGNDDDYVDEQVAWVLHEWITEFNQLTNLRGGRGGAGGSVMSGYVPAGKVVGALPSGRLAGEPLADASSPGVGMDLEGPTAVLKSMGKIDSVEILGGITFNLRIDPAVFKDGDVSRLADLIRTFVDQKIFHMQINVVSSDTLRSAQEKPEEYRDLLVKVAGYSAFFTRLSKPLQDSIIARTEHGI